MCPAGHEPTVPRASETPGQQLADTSAVAPSGKLGGRWREIERPPFAGPYHAAIWTGDEVLILDARQGRIAAYRPERGSWRELSSPPRPFARWSGPSVWTGEELLVLEEMADGVIVPEVRGLAYAPASDTWREIPEVTLPFDSPRRISGRIWTGGDLVIVTTDRHVAAYDPVADCWTRYPDVPAVADAYAEAIYWSGETLIAETRSEEAGVQLTLWDPATTSWGEPIQGPTDPMAAGGLAHWVDGRLAYLTWEPGGLTGMLDAFFDPATRTWEPATNACASSLAGAPATEVAGLLVDTNARRALDPRTGACYELPQRVRPLYSGSQVWSGKTLYYLSGLPGDRGPDRRHAESYRLAARLDG